jgi:hypothetical protein
MLFVFAECAHSVLPGSLILLQMTLPTYSKTPNALAWGCVIVSLEYAPVSPASVAKHVKSMTVLVQSRLATVKAAAMI